MALTCVWEKPLGTCYNKYDTENEHPITIYGGGNCLAIFTTADKNNGQDKNGFQNKLIHTLFLLSE